MRTELRQLRLHILLAALSVQAGPAFAEWRGATGLRVSETYSDNIARQPSGRERNDFATEISPWISYGGRGARTAGNIDARVQNWLHTDAGTSNRSDLQLNGFGTVEAYEDYLFVDSSITRNRQRISRFKAADSSYGGTGNSTQVTRFSLSPYMRWHLGDATEGELRYRFDNVHSDTDFTDGQANTLSANIHNGTAFGRLGWQLNAQHYNFDGKTRQADSSDSYSAGLTYAFAPSLNGHLSGGQESNDYKGGMRQHYWHWATGLKWVPDERTTMSGEVSRHFFGHGYNYQISQRMRRSFFNLNIARDISTNTSTSSLYAYEYDIALASVDPAITDPVRRRIEAVKALVARGITAGDATTNVDYVSSNAVLERRLYMGWILQGARNQLNVSAYQSDRQTINTSGVAVLGDDLSIYQRVKSRNLNIGWTHNLSALTSTGLQYTWSSSEGFVSTTNLRTNTHSNVVALSLSTQLAPYTIGGVSVTHSISKGAVDYRENAVTGYLNHTF